MVEVVIPVQVKPKLHDASIIKQIILNRRHPLDMVREALSNMMAPQVGATRVEIIYHDHPEFGATFTFRDDGCGMRWSRDPERPERLDRFIDFGFSAAAGLPADKFGWKGLGSKLMLNCKNLELTTWTGNPHDKVYDVRIEDPRGTILRDKPQLPNVEVSQREPKETSRKGTVVTVSGYDGGLKSYWGDEVVQYLYQRTIVGYTNEDVSSFPKVFLKIGGAAPVELKVGYRFIRPVIEADGTKSWRTVVIDPAVIMDKTTSTGKPVHVVLKGGYTLDTGRFNLSPFRDNTGLKLSVLGIPTIDLDWNEFKGDKFQVYKNFVNFIVECDELHDKLNLDRSGYNSEDEVAKVFERAVRECFNELASRAEHATFQDRRRMEDEAWIAQHLASRKAALTAPNQQYVYLLRNDQLIYLHRVPENEHDTLALFWKLEVVSGHPFHRFRSLEHTNAAGIDVIANFQETPQSEPKVAVAVEFEYAFENFGNNPQQTSVIVCWKVRHPERLEAVPGMPYKYRARFDASLVDVYEISRFPNLVIKKVSEKAIT